MLNLTVGEALERQHELAQFWHSKLGRDFSKRWVNVRDTDKYVTDFEAEKESHLLLRCPLYLVSADMQAVALHAARSMPYEQLASSDLPSTEGFVVLEKSIHSPDVHNKITGIAAWSWRRVHAQIERTKDGPKEHTLAIVLTYYSDRDDEQDEYLQKTRLETTALTDTRWPRYIVLAQNFIPLDAAPIESTRQLAQHHEMVLVMDKLPRALWALMRQRIHETTEQRAERHVRRRLEREGSPLAQRLVRVVNLRKVVHEVQPGGGGAPVQWQQRWIVSGHWRNVWHASIQQHRLQWIAPFVKGPEDKPLVIKKTVGKLVR